MTGTRASPVFVAVDRLRFQPAASRPELMNLFKQTFSEILAKKPCGRIGYRLSLDAKKADQLSYLVFPFGVLNLLAYERGLETSEFTSQSFSKRALAYADGDKFAACDARIEGRPEKWSNSERLAALSAWMTLDA